MEKIWNKIAKLGDPGRGYAAVLPLLRQLPPEAAHHLSLKLIGMVPWSMLPINQPEKNARFDCLGLSFPNRVGLAAGFSKNAEALTGLFALGFGFVEIGSVTPRPQPGNPKPRVFRLPKDCGLINRYGFNSQGHDVVYRRLADWRDAAAKRGFGGIVGVNLGKNKDSDGERALRDYADGVKLFAALADYLVINISSPNTPGLRAWQAKAALQPLLASVLAARAQAASKPPLLLKIAPDLTLPELAELVELSLELNIDGLIVGNTTISRPEGLHAAPATLAQQGGLSGAPLMPLSTQMLAAARRMAGAKLPIIGVGGISSAADAANKFDAGATLIQLYTGLIYNAGLLPALLAQDKAAIAPSANRAAGHTNRA
jgi:dihydroorotate dehydrogenase